MAMYTNVSQRLIHTPDGTMMVPGQPTDVSEECISNQGFQDLVDAGDIKAGEVSPEDVEKSREERQQARQGEDDMTRREQRQEHREERQEQRHQPPHQQQPQRQAPPQPPRREA